MRHCKKISECTQSDDLGFRICLHKRAPPFYGAVFFSFAALSSKK